MFVCLSLLFIYGSVLFISVFVCVCFFRGCSSKCFVFSHLSRSAILSNVQSHFGLVLVIIFSIYYILQLSFCCSTSSSSLNTLVIVSCLSLFNSHCLSYIFVVFICRVLLFGLRIFVRSFTECLYAMFEAFMPKRMVSTWGIS